MAEPTLSQITGIQGDAAIAGGTAGPGGAAPAPVTLPDDQSLPYLSQAAQARYNANQYIDKMYTDNMKDFVSNLGQQDLSKVMDKDLPVIRQKYADLAHDVANNYDVIRNPNVNPAKYAELKQREAALRGDIAQSGSHSAILDENKKMALLHPDWNTDENKKMMLDYANTPVDKRQSFFLNAPTTFDLKKIADIAAPMAAEEKNEDILSPDGRYNIKKKSTVYNVDKFKSAIHTILDTSTLNGKSVRDEFSKQYRSLPPEIRDTYTDENDFLDRQAINLLPKNAVTTSQTESKYGLEAQKTGDAMKMLRARQAFEADQNNKNRALQAKALKKGEIDPDAAGEQKLRTFGNLLTNGTIDPVSGQNTWGDNKNKVVRTVKRSVLDENGSPVMKTVDGKSIGIPETENDKIQVPAIEFKGTTLDKDGNVHVHLLDNRNNQPIDRIETQSQAYSSLNNMLGPEYAGAVSSGSHKYSEKNFKKVTPGLNEIQTHFNIPIDPNAARDPKPFDLSSLGQTIFSPDAPIPGTGTPVVPKTPPTVSSAEEYQSLPKGTQYMSDGKLYIKK